MAPKNETEESNEKFDISILFKFIKPFDGSREKLNSFISNCNSAYSLGTSSQKPILFKYITSQLEGKAELASSIKEFESWEQLSKFLRTQFGEKKHFTHLLAELQECRQSPSEVVNQFGLKVETCLSKLLTEITLSNKKKHELPGKIAAMEDLALHTFVLGLQPKISNLVRMRDPSSLNEAINLGISEETIQKLTNRNQAPSSPHTRPPRFENRSNQNSYRANPIHQNQPRQTYPNAIICNYCKNPGHTINNCRKREFNNRRFSVQNPKAQTFSPQRQNPSYNNQNRINFLDQQAGPPETQHDYEDQPETNLNM